MLGMEQIRGEIGVLLGIEFVLERMRALVNVCTDLLAARALALLVDKVQVPGLGALSPEHWREAGLPVVHRCDLGGAGGLGRGQTWSDTRGLFVPSVCTCCRASRLWASPRPPNCAICPRSHRGPLSNLGPPSGVYRGSRRRRR